MLVIYVLINPRTVVTNCAELCTRWFD